MKIDKPLKCLIGLVLLALALISIVSASSLIWGIAGALYAFGIVSAIFGLGFCMAGTDND